MLGSTLALTGAPGLLINVYLAPALRPSPWFPGNAEENLVTSEQHPSSLLEKSSLTYITPSLSLSVFNVSSLSLLFILNNCLIQLFCSIHITVRSVRHVLFYQTTNKDYENKCDWWLCQWESSNSVSMTQHDHENLVIQLGERERALLSQTCCCQPPQFILQPRLASVLLIPH